MPGAILQVPEAAPSHASCREEHGHSTAALIGFYACWDSIGVYQMDAYMPKEGPLKSPHDSYTSLGSIGKDLRLFEGR